jgi:hypothetical protein
MVATTLGVGRWALTPHCVTSMADMNSVNIFKKAVFFEQFSVIICHKKDLFPSPNSVNLFNEGVFFEPRKSVMVNGTTDDVNGGHEFSKYFQESCVS